MGKVLRDFHDSQDDMHLYRTGDIYPRDGVNANEERFNHLVDKEFIEGPKRIPQPNLELEKLSVEAIKEYTKDEIKNRLDVLGIEYKSNDSKDDLIKILKGDSIEDGEGKKEQKEDPNNGEQTETKE